MSTPKSKTTLDAALANIPARFRTRLIKHYLDIKQNCLESRKDAAGVAAGKFCEVTLRMLQDKITGNFTPFNKPIERFPDACRSLITASASAGSESERIVIPRAIVFVYTMRNKRSIAHIGGSVDSSAIDIATVARVADWVVCEPISGSHGLSLEEAQDVLDGLAARQMPTIWEVAGKKRVLKEGLSAKDQTLLLLYSTRDTFVLMEDMLDWIEYSNPSVYAKSVVVPLHKKRFLDFDKENSILTLSPTGAKYVEDHLLMP